MITTTKNYVRLCLKQAFSITLIDFAFLDRIHFHATEVFENEYYDVNSELFIRLGDELCDSLEKIFTTAISSQSQFPCSLIYVR